MKTKLPEGIKTVEEAKKFLKELYDNGKSYHPEDAAGDIIWHWIMTSPTTEEQEVLDKLMTDIYNLPGNDGRHCGEMIFDPCEYLLSLDPEYNKKIEEDTENE